MVDLFMVQVFIWGLLSKSFCFVFDFSIAGP